MSLDRLQPGLVDTYAGPDQLRRDVGNGPVRSPAALLRWVRALRAELPSSGLAADREAFLHAQLTAVEMTARTLDGERVGFVAQVEAYFQVRPALGDVETYASAHVELDLLLPGPGGLAERYAAYRARVSVPPERLAEVVRAVSALLRARARRAVPMPAGEEVDYELVTGQPWAGFNHGSGPLRSTVAVSTDLPVGLGALPALLAHEAYPGHHTERCRRQQRLSVLPERAICLLNTPENLLAEGLAELGLAGLDLLAWGAPMTELYAGLGLGYDGDLGERVARAVAPLTAVRQDAALLLHDRGATLGQAQEHLARWALLPPERVHQTLAFVTHPLWRTYFSTYVEGERLVSAWLAARPARQPVAGRFVRLLDEPLTPAGLRAELPLQLQLP